MGSVKRLCRVRVGWLLNSGCFGFVVFGLMGWVMGQEYFYRYPVRAGAVELTVADVKSNMSVLHDADDAKIARLLAAAIGFLEGEYGLSIYRTDVWLHIEKFEDCIELKKANNCELLSVNYFDVDGAELEFSLANVRQSQFMTNFLRLRARAGSVWPAHYPQFGDVVVKYKAGWAVGDAVKMPVEIGQAVMLIVGEWYKENSDTTDTKKYALSNGAARLMSGFKVI